MPHTGQTWPRGSTHDAARVSGEPSTGQGLVFDAPSGLWVPADLATAAALAAHEAATTSVHGVADTANLIVEGDPRLSDTREPTAHATSHQPGGSDALAVDAAAGTGSLRTLGTGAQQAAAGDHIHTDINLAWQSWTPTLTGWSSDPPGIYRFIQLGKLVIAYIRHTGNGTSNASTATVTLPPGINNGSEFVQFPAAVVDNGTPLAAYGRGTISGGASAIAFTTGPAGGGFTASGIKRIVSCTLTFEAA